MTNIIKLETLELQSEKLTNNKEHQAKIHNEILEDLKDVTATFEDECVGYDNAKAIIKAIAQGKIRNLKIIY
jgi:hypothetical protein